MTPRTPRGASPPRGTSLAVAALLAVSAVAGATACSSEPELEASVDAAAARVGRLQDDLVDVAERQAAATDALDRGLAAVRALDEVVPLLADEERLDDGLAAFRRVGPALDDADPGASRPLVREVAFAADRARVSLRRAREALGAVPEDVAYLDATDVVLERVRVLSAAEDALAQVVQRHLDVYRRLRDKVLDFASRRGRYRSAAEATDALSVEIRREVADLALAQEDIATFASERLEAAAAVNDAQAAAQAAFRDRGDG